MNVVDSSAWLSYFAGDKNAGAFAKPIEAIEELLVPSITLTEVFKWGLSGSRKGYKQLNGHRFTCTFDGANPLKRQRKQNLWPRARLSENY